MAKRVILDTNFLFIPSQFKLDIFEELNQLLGGKIEPVMLSPSYDELKKLARSRSVKMGKQASLGLQLAKKCAIVNVEREGGESNDDLILRIASLWKSPVATNDRELRKRLRSAGIPVIFLRGKSRLAVEGSV